MGWGGNIYRLQPEFFSPKSEGPKLSLEPPIEGIFRIILRRYVPGSDTMLLFSSLSVKSPYPLSEPPPDTELLELTQMRTDAVVTKAVSSDLISSLPLFYNHSGNSDPSIVLTQK